MAKASKDGIDAALKKSERVYIPRIPGAPEDQQRMLIGINGKNTMLKRGEYVNVPKYVADHIRECLTSEERAEMNAEALSRQQKKEMAEVLANS